MSGMLLITRQLVTLRDFRGVMASHMCALVILRYIQYAGVSHMSWFYEDRGANKTLHPTVNRLEAGNL